MTTKTLKVEGANAWRAVSLLQLANQRHAQGEKAMSEAARLLGLAPDEKIIRFGVEEETITIEKAPDKGG